MTVGLPNKRLAEDTATKVADLATADARIFDAVLIAPGGPGARREAEKFASKAEMFYFVNTADP